mgnify:CR=1 FL=1
MKGCERWPAADDQLVSPTYVPDLVQAALNLLIDDERGVWHVANRGAVSWAGFAQMVAEAAGLDAALVDAVPGEPGRVRRRLRQGEQPQGARRMHRAALAVQRLEGRPGEERQRTGEEEHRACSHPGHRGCRFVTPLDERPHPPSDGETDDSQDGELDR